MKQIIPIGVRDFLPEEVEKREQIIENKRRI